MVKSYERSETVVANTGQPSGKSSHHCGNGEVIGKYVKSADTFMQTIDPVTWHDCVYLGLVSPCQLARMENGEVVPQQFIEFLHPETISWYVTMCMMLATLSRL